MNEIIIGKKKYVLIPRKEFDQLQKRAALKTKPEKVFNISQARAYSKALINKWAKEQ